MSEPRDRGTVRSGLDFDAFEILSFDCYGTLIDWETGILAALSPLLARHGHEVAAKELLEAFAFLESRIEGGTYRTYATVLREVVAGLGEKFGFRPSPDECDSLAASLPDWPPFPDTRQALRALKRKYRLAIISNTDDDLFAGTATKLGIEWDWIITAQQVGSYKPSINNFRRALARFGSPPENVLHVAQSLFHDIAPAQSLGLRTVWVNRRRDRPGTGATPAATARPDVVVHDLKRLAELSGVA